MSFITSIGGSRIGRFYDFAYWAAKLREPERWLSEVDNRQFLIHLPRPRKDMLQAPNNFDWTWDLVTTGDVLRIEELWLFCPRTPQAPQGSTGVLRFEKNRDEGTAFQFNITKMSDSYGRIDSKVIGKVLDRTEGTCVCYIWDGQARRMTDPYITNVNDFKSWTPKLANPGHLQKEVIGLRL